MADKIQLRRDTEINWNNEDPILDSGEAGVNLTTGGIRIGNGIDNWSNLEEISAGGGGSGLESLYIAAHIVDGDTLPTTDVRWESVPSGWIIAAESANAGTILFYETDGTDTLVTRTITPLSATTLVAINTKAEDADALFGGSTEAGMFTILPSGWDGTASFWGPMSEFPPKINSQQVEIDGPYTNIGAGSGANNLTSIITSIDTKLGEGGGGGGGTQEITLYKCFVECADSEIPLTDAFWANIPSGSFVYVRGITDSGVYVSDGVDTITPQLIGPLDYGVIVQCNYRFNNWADMSSMTGMAPGTTYFFNTGVDISNPGSLDPHNFNLNAGSVMVGGTYSNLGITDTFDRVSDVLSVLEDRLPTEPPETGTYIWKSVDGVMSWVEEV